jgi:hypothetical protein
MNLSRSEISKRSARPTFTNGIRRWYTHPYNVETDTARYRAAYCTLTSRALGERGAPSAKPDLGNKAKLPVLPRACVVRFLLAEAAYPRDSALLEPT